MGVAVAAIRYAPRDSRGLFAGMAAPTSCSVGAVVEPGRHTAGIGVIALALVVFASWRPARPFGAFLFGFARRANFAAGQGSTSTPSFLSMLPYLLTIAVSVLWGGHAGGAASAHPARSACRTFERADDRHRRTRAPSGDIT